MMDKQRQIEENERSPFLMCEDYDAYLDSMSKTELLEYFHFVMGNYKHSLDKVTLENIELQEQVDELKGKICELVADKCNLVVKEKQAIKDTANKVYKGLCERKNWDDMKEAIRWGDESEELKALISRIVGVEVE